MADERFRIAIDEPYLVALGRALFIFAELEWNAVWCAERLQAGYTNTVGTKTAGQVAADFDQLTRAMAAGCVAERTALAARDFRRLVGVRNDIMHAQPCHAPTGEERLVRRGEIWMIPELEAAADEFAACSIELNELFHHWLD